MTYSVIGPDGREHGPLTATQIRESITLGRFTVECLVKASGSGIWKRAREVPEIADHDVGQENPDGPPAGDYRIRDLLPAVPDVVTLRPESVATFVLTHAPSYNRTGAQLLWQDLWKNPAGTTTTTLLVPNDQACIMIAKEGNRPTARGAAFALNRKGWISIPEGFLGQMIRPDRPLSMASQESLDQLYHNLSAMLFEHGEACGLLRFANGNAVRIDMKEDSNNLRELMFKITFLAKGSYGAAEYDPAVALAWPEETSLQVVNHGSPRSDGWRVFSLLQAAVQTSGDS